MGEEEVKRSIAVIPARGGSKGIPRKNARLIGGKPLLSYVIETAIAADCFAEVFVSTDDPELAEIAQRFSATVIERPPALAGDAATLDEVVADACRQLQESGRICEHTVVATIQPTSPLLKTVTVRNSVVRCLKGDCDTVVTVFNEPHLAWTIEDDRTMPLYAARVNRQDMKPYLRETGSVVVCPVKQLESGSRFGPRVEVIEVEKEESLDIDDYFDWWMAEKALFRREILFHVVGNRSTGLGHVYRVLTLAYRLPSHHVRFVVNRRSELAAGILQAKHQDVEIVECGEELDYVLRKNPDLLINDILDTGSDFMVGVKNAGIWTVNFEDRGPGSLYADVLINAMHAKDSITAKRNSYHGLDYCCLRDEFYTIAPRDSTGPVRNILLLFGGTDPSDLTRKCLKWIDKLAGNWDVTIVIGPGYPGSERLENLARNCRHSVTIEKDTNVISKHMAEADLAVTSAGRTVFELTAMAVPMIVIAQNEREESHSFATTTPGAVYLGRADRLKESDFVSTVEELVEGKILRTKMTEILKATDIRGGVGRVLDLIENMAKASDRKTVIPKSSV